MKRKIIYLLLIITILSNVVKSQPSTFYTGKTDTLYSEILKENRPLFVYLPDEYYDSGIKYPVIYILDGETRCSHAVPTIAFMTGLGLVPPSIIVGIPNTDRDRDFLPGKLPELSGKDSAYNFLHFITKELFPFIQKHYETSESRILIGHSKGGLFALYALINMPEAFDSFIMIDPAFSSLSNSSKNGIATFFKERQDFPKSVYISGRSGPGMTEMGIQNADSIIKATAPKNFRLKTQEYTGENHTSIAFKTIYDGLRFIYEGYIVPGMMVFPENGMFIEENPFTTIIVTREPCVIRYTLDGTIPDENSLLIKPDPDPKTGLYFTPAININNPCTLKLWIPSRFSNSEVVSCVYASAPPIEAVKTTGKLKNGICYKYFEGDLDKLPDFSKLKPVETGTMENIAFKDSFKKEFFAVQYEGMVNINEDGYYDIGIRSDDGSRVCFNNRQMLDYDGLHDATEFVNYRLYLKKGYYPLQIEYFNKSGEGEKYFMFVKYPWATDSSIFCPKELLFYKD